jgi:hypothetical protein
MEEDTSRFRLSRARILFLGLVLLLIGLQIGIIVTLRRDRAAAQPVLERADDLIALSNGGPYIELATVRGLLAMAATDLSDLADSHIRYTVHISEMVPIATDILVDERIPVQISVVLSNTVPIKAAIPVQKQILVPVNLDIDQQFFVSTTVPFRDAIVVPIDEVIHIDESFETRVLGQTVSIPVRGDIPVRMEVTVPIDTAVPVQANVPVAFPIAETLTVDIDWEIPIDLDVPVAFPVETQVTVPFKRTIPISLEVPVVLDVPIDIALGDTAFGAYLRDLGDLLP